MNGSSAAMFISTPPPLRDVRSNLFPFVSFQQRPRICRVHHCQLNSIVPPLIRITAIQSNVTRSTSASLKTANARYTRKAARQIKPSVPHPRVEQNICLPQHCGSHVEEVHRKRKIQEHRRIYRFKYEGVGNAALLDSLPASEKPNRRWMAMMKRVERECLENSEAIKRKRVESGGDLDVQRSSDEGYFHVHRSLFDTLSIPSIAMRDSFLRDDVFAWYRVAGPNPMRLRRLNEDVHVAFSGLSDEILRGVPNFAEDSVQAMQEERRLFYVDYPELDELKTGSLPNGTPKESMHIYSPKALFAIPKRPPTQTQTLFPIAIRTSQNISTPLLTPNQDHTSVGAWCAGKMAVQVADGYTHETVHHFAHTHLLLEATLCASKRTLSEDHPILRLLLPHFEGTAFINEASLRQLVAPGGTIDCITAPQIESTREFSALSLTEGFSFSDAMPDIDLRNRGVCDDRLNFPYREDSLRIWGSILRWSTRYIDAFYESDSDVTRDTEVAAWAQEIANAGRIRGVGELGDGQIRGKKYLARAVGMIIFTASVQHAAVNFPQETHMQFTPSMPLSGRLPAQGLINLDTIEDVAKEMMPSPDQAEKQLNAARMLGVVRYTQLGEYGDALNFANQKVHDGLRMFQVELREIEQRIVCRNGIESDDGLPLYDFLKPSSIPMSTNV